MNLNTAINKALVTGKFQEFDLPNVDLEHMAMEADEKIQDEYGQCHIGYYPELPYYVEVKESQSPQSDDGFSYYGLADEYSKDVKVLLEILGYEDLDEYLEEQGSACCNAPIDDFGFCIACKEHAR